jgi:hypothetical protein
MSMLRKCIKRDKNAGIEGLPLQLMIMVVIAGLGTAILLGWMGGLSAPNGIDVVYSNPSEIILTDSNNDGVYDRSDLSLTISVIDKQGDAVKGATVVLDGCNLRTGDGKQVHGITDEMGKVTFTGLSASQSGRSVGFITATVTKNDLGTDDSLTIPVVSE